MREVLEMNKGISEDRYAGIESHNVITQIFLIFCYVAPLIGGFCFRWCKKWEKILSLMTLIPGTFVALTQAMKMGMVSGVILWITGFFVCSFTYHMPLRIKLKNFLTIIFSITILFALLFFSMVIRTGEVSEKTIVNISQSFISYALGQFHCFDMWYTSYELTSLSWGTKTFLGISNILGLEERTQGVYAEFYQIGQNGFYGLANIFTIFRSLIEDFGEVGTAIFMFSLGCVSKISLKNLIAGNRIFFHQIITAAIYAYLLWSFATSFFTYTSYIAMFFVAYCILVIIQKESKPSSQSNNS
jgi:oligosaccharide repeat unit polymerase